MTMGQVQALREDREIRFPYPGRQRRYSSPKQAVGRKKRRPGVRNGRSWDARVTKGVQSSWAQEKAQGKKDKSVEKKREKKVLGTTGKTRL
jgi:hypothetical protein